MQCRYIRAPRQDKCDSSCLNLSTPPVFCARKSSAWFNCTAPLMFQDSESILRHSREGAPSSSLPRLSAPKYVFEGLLSTAGKPTNHDSETTAHGIPSDQSFGRAMHRVANLSLLVPWVAAWQCCKNKNTKQNRYFNGPHIVARRFTVLKCSLTVRVRKKESGDCAFGPTKRGNAIRDNISQLLVPPMVQSFNVCIHANLAALPVSRLVRMNRRVHTHPAK